MVLYIGDKPVGLMKVVEKKVPKVKFGVSIDNFIGDVDENGTLTPASTTDDFVLDLTGVKTISNSALSNIFANKGLPVTLIAPDVIQVDGSGFDNFAPGASSYYVRFDNLESITGNSAFHEAFRGGTISTPTYDVVFAKLKTIKGDSCFAYDFDKQGVAFGEIFPSLEEIEGSTVFRGYSAPSSHTLTHVRKIVGASSKYSATFYTNISGDVHWYFPSLTEISGYAFYSSTSYRPKLHFAAANQAAIEACPGYEYLFGATEIYFDL